MQITSLLLLICVGVLPATLNAEYLAADGDRFMLGGIQVNESDQAAWAELLHARGYNTLQVTVYARQPR
ncbi:MAG: hypothetical protein AAGL98_03580, partial [Planctomycetota bacterium]